MKSIKSQSQSDELQGMELDDKESKFKVKNINEINQPNFIDLKYHTGSINSIAFEIGFLSYSNFCNAFKRITGTTPEAYRNLEILKKKRIS